MRGIPGSAVRTVSFCCFWKYDWSPVFLYLARESDVSAKYLSLADDERISADGALGMPDHHNDLAIGRKSMCRRRRTLRMRAQRKLTRPDNLFRQEAIMAECRHGRRPEM